MKYLKHQTELLLKVFLKNSIFFFFKSSYILIKFFKKFYKKKKKKNFRFSYFDYLFLNGLL